MTPDFPVYLADRIERERRLADEAGEMFALTGDDVWLSLHRLHVEDLADLTAELAALDDAHRP